MIAFLLKFLFISCCRFSDVLIICFSLFYGWHEIRGYSRWIKVDERILYANGFVWCRDYASLSLANSQYWIALEILVFFSFPVHLVHYVYQNISRDTNWYRVSTNGISAPSQKNIWMPRIYALCVANNKSFCEFIKPITSRFDQRVSRNNICNNQYVLYYLRK